MNELTYSKSYNEYRQDVMQELSKASESFVRIGYLLKVARDTDVLKGTEYESDYLGKIAPLEYCQEDIRNVIISSRRQDILLNLEQDLLKDARENGEFVIF